MIEELKLNLIQWVLEIQNPDTLQSIWEWKEQEKKECEARVFALCGSWKSEERGDELAKEIYEVRYDEPRDIKLSNNKL